MNVSEILAERVADWLAAGDDRVALGEDVRDGGMLGLTRRAAERDELAPRLLGTPLVPESLPAYAAGLALGGKTPLVLMPSAAALLDALPGLAACADPTWRRVLPGGRVVFVAPCGPGFGLGEDAHLPVEASLCAVPGLTVRTVGHPAGALAALDRALSDDCGAVVLLVPRGVLVEPAADTAGDAAAGAHLHRAGEAAAVVTWGPATLPTLAAVEQSGVDAAVLELTDLAPLDLAAVLPHARAGKILVVHGGPRGAGPGAEVVARLADEAVWHIDAPVRRLCGDDGPFPPTEESRGLPAQAAIVAAVRGLVT